MRKTPPPLGLRSIVHAAGARLSVGLAAALLSACAAAPPPPPPPPPAPTTTAPEPAPSSSGVESEIGGMNEEAMERAFNALGPAIQGCVEAGSGRVKALGGHLTFELRIQKDGAVRWVYLKESTLGDQDTEKCLLDSVRAKVWPLPVGGEGLAQRSLDLDPPAAPLVVDEDRAKRSIAAVRKEAAKCRKGARGTFAATVYIRTNGAVLSAGVAPPNAKGQEAADCMAGVIRKVKFVGPGSKTGKLSFTL